jgi:hypothetical protein
MFKGYVYFLNVSFKKFPTNQFIRNFCPYYIILEFFSFHFLSIFSILLFFHFIIIIIIIKLNYKEESRA